MVVDRAHVLLEDWHSANITGMQQQAFSHNEQPMLRIIQPSDAHIHDVPSCGRLKCNIDASLSIYQNRTGISLSTDDEGNFMLAKTMDFAAVHAVDVGEALGLYHALEWLSDMQLDDIEFEVDSRTTQLAFYARKDDVSEFSNVITACRGIFSTKFTNSRVEFIRRQSNEVVHVLVGEAALVASPTIYYHAPLCIDNLIFNEKL